MEFVDEVRITAKGGDGGSGLVGWRREKYLPKGGPDGGNGGDGGAVILVADSSKNNLIDFSFSPLLRAGKGQPGGTNEMTGKNGRDEVRSVPLGTQVFYNDSLIADLSVRGARWIAAKGGRGGKGNAHFKSATDQAPQHAQPGQPGDEFEFKLVLKSVADIGLVGLPNVGKSTLISALTEARPKVASYPFTTLSPNLGVVILDEQRRFVIADIPGLIPGAHKGKGLGLQFLKHIERTSALLQMIDLSETAFQDGNTEIDDEMVRTKAIEQFLSIEKELLAFAEHLADFPRIVAISKADLEVNQRAYQLCQDYFRERNLPFLLISSVTGHGLKELTEELYKTVD